MSDPTDIAARTQRFRDAVRAFTPPPPKRHAKANADERPHHELRQKGASLGPCPQTTRNRRRNGQHRNDRAVSRGDSHNLASARQRQRFACERTPVQNTIRVQPAAVLKGGARGQI